MAQHVLQTSLLCNVPQEIMTSIAYELVTLDPLGSPSSLVSLLLTCRDVYGHICFTNASHLYAAIFRFKFDHRAAVRRFGPRAAQSSNVASQLKKYCMALNIIRRGDVWVENISEVLWLAFFMCSENDGRNAEQLRWAGLSNFVQRFVRERLWQRSELMPHGWPPESNINALALWLMWFTLDHETLTRMTPDEREGLKTLIRPYVITAVRYPSSHVPDNHFDLPLSERLSGEFPYLLITPHGFYPLYRQPDMLADTTQHYGMNLTIQAPLITQAAKLLYFACLEVIQFPPPPGIPENRAQADALGLPEGSPTVEDFLEMNAHRSAQLVDVGSWDWRADLDEEQGQLEDDGVWRKGLKSTSARWDNDWQRWNYCWDPWDYNDLKGVVYTYGSLNGLWQGRAIIPEIDGYFRLVQSQDFPQDFSSMNPMLTMIPIYMNLREHHCINPELPLGIGGRNDGFDEGLCNAWFPRHRLREDKDTGIVTCEDYRGRISRYETYIEGKKNSHNPDTCTLCLARKEFEEEELRRRIRVRLQREHLEQRRLSTQGVVERHEPQDITVGEALRWVRTGPSRHPENNDNAHEAEDPSTVSGTEYSNHGIDADEPGLFSSGVDTSDEVAQYHSEASAAVGGNVDDLIDAERRSVEEQEEGEEEDYIDDSDSDTHSTSTDYIENTCNGIQDIIVTGETLPRHGMAWVHYGFYGRVRRYDGLVAIVRYERSHPTQNVWIFRGYVTGDKNFVGSWRTWSDEVTVIPLEGPFVLSKVANPIP